MRICPKCGYVDPPEWRHSKYSYWIDFTEYTNWLLMGFPKLEKGQHHEDKFFVYRRMKRTGRMVERKAKIDYGYQWMIPMEHVNRDGRKCWNLPKETKLEKWIK